jgi:hypothetical protein
MHHLHLFAGLSWDPAIKGILVVAVGVAILIGSVLLIVGTNTGSRLGLLITLGGLFGWLSILTMYWWIQPPGIGPRGQDPSWKPVEIYVHEPGAGPAKTEVLDLLPEPATLPTGAQVIAEHPELASQIVGKPENTSLSDIAAIKNGDTFTGADILKQYYGISPPSRATRPAMTSSRAGSRHGLGAGEASAAADAAIIESGLFPDATGYKAQRVRVERGADPSRGLSDGRG